MRVTSDFWVSAYVRRRNDAGFFTAVTRRGAAEAGAVFVKIDRLDGTCDFYGPAPQSSAMDDWTPSAGGRLFERLAAVAPEAEISERLAREGRFDPDYWLVESESRDGSHDLDLIDV
jgi:hypothetical protein